jgi:hypothetical protein
MRLLLRSNSHRDLGDGGFEVAASPDTPRRELWQWDLRVVPADRAAGHRPRPSQRVGADLLRGNDSFSRVEVSADPAAVRPSIEVLQISGRQGINRGPQELVAVIVGRGQALAEGRHRLGELDAMILEGDDPYVLSLEPNGCATASVAVVRLHGTVAIGWVP